MDRFTVVLEDDGSEVSEEVITEIIQEGVSLGTLMILGPTEAWFKGISKHIIEHL